MSAWLPWSAPADMSSAELIVPEEVLFYFDEPLIFTSSFLGCPAICYKYAEDDDAENSYYIAAPTSDRMISGLKKGHVSIRGALSIPSVWIYEADTLGNVQRRWSCSFEELPESTLPVRNVGLKKDFGSVPDQLTLRRSDAPFMSINFLGGILHAGSINLLDFKHLIDNTYDCLKDIVRRALLENGSEKLTVGQLERMLNIPLRQPNLASLRLDVGQPKIEERQGWKGNEVNHQKIYNGLDRYRSRFLDTAGLISQEALSRRFSLSFARENIEAIENILGIIPNEETVFSTVEIIAEGAPLDRIRIDAESGQKILDAYKRVQREPRTISGQVVEVNFRSDSFIIKSYNGREVTCVIPNGWPGKRPTKAGEEVRLFGKLQSRKRRDLFMIDREILAQEKS